MHSNLQQSSLYHCNCERTFSLEVNLTRKRSSMAANCRNCACRSFVHVCQSGFVVGWLDGRGRLCASTLRSIHPHTHSHPDVPTFHCTADTLVLQSTTTPFWMVEAAVTPVRVLPAPQGRTMMPGVSVSGMVCLVWCFFGGG